jgi:hypothetical protein
MNVERRRRSQHQHLREKEEAEEIGDINEVKRLRESGCDQGQSRGQLMKSGSGPSIPVSRWPTW